MADDLPGVTGAGAIVSVYALFGTAEEAARIGRAMVEERLAACVNLLAPCRSIYRWKGAIEEGDEFPAIFKTGAARSAALVARIAELHSYDTPAIVVWPVAATGRAYAEWVALETGQETAPP